MSTDRGFMPEEMAPSVTDAAPDIVPQADDMASREAHTIRGICALLHHMGVRPHVEMKQSQRQVTELMNLGALVVSRMPENLRNTVRLQFGIGGPPMQLEEAASVLKVGVGQVYAWGLEADTYLKRLDIVHRVQQSVDEIAKL